MTPAFPLKPIEQVWQWQYEGLCRTTGPDLFFHPERERGPARWLRDERAKQVCFQCPVMQQCREHALAGEEPYGVWGGMSERELHTARHQQRESA